MITVKMDFDADAFKRSLEKQVIEAAEKQVREKLRAKGILNVSVRASGIKGDNVTFIFSGEDAEIQKAKEALGYKSAP